MNLSNEFVKSEWQSFRTQSLLTKHTSCVWIPKTQYIIITSDSLENLGGPIEFGSLDIRQITQSSLLLDKKLHTTVCGMSYHDNNILICGKGVILRLSLKDASTAVMFRSKDCTFNCVSYRPDGSMWFATTNTSTKSSMLFRANKNSTASEAVNLSAVRVCGLRKIGSLQWSPDGKVCYMTCPVTMRIYATRYDENKRSISTARVFTYYPINEEIVAIKCDPFGNVFACTKSSLFVWDQQGHILYSTNANVDDIIDFVATDREVVLLYRFYSTKIKTEFHKRPVSKKHLTVAREK